MYRMVLFNARYHAKNNTKVVQDTLHRRMGRGQARLHARRRARDNAWEKRRRRDGRRGPWHDRVGWASILRTAGD